MITLALNTLPRIMSCMHEPKHIEVEFHFVRDQVKKYILNVRYVPMADQIIDVFTKSLPTSHFSKIKHKLLVLLRPK